MRVLQELAIIVGKINNNFFLMELIPKSRGFTLIELLVTISIIAVLSVIGIVAYSSVVRQGRDSKRQSDLRAIQSALEQYNSDQGFYPTQNLIISKDNGLDTLLGNQALSQRFHSNIGNQTLSATPKVYINSLPQDPNTTPRYKYVALPNTPCDNTTIARCTSYELCAKLENSSVTSFSCGGASGYNFKVTPP